MMLRLIPRAAPIRSNAATPFKRAITALAVVATLVANGGAAASELGTVTFLSQLGLQHSGFITDVWGYVDPSNDREYALVGNWVEGKGFWIIDCTDPSSVSIVRKVTSNNGFIVSGFDVKAWGHYVFGVNGFTGGGLGTVTDISNLLSPVTTGFFPTGHNIAIDPRGYLWNLGTGVSREVKIYDMNPDVNHPAFEWEDNIGGTHDAVIVGNRAYDFHGSRATRIYDISNPIAPVLLGRIKNADIVGFHHSGYPTEDGKHLFICNELAVHPHADITVWNIEDPASPVYVTSFSEAASSVHNLYIVGDYAYVSYYTAGFYVFDVSDPTSPRLADSFDTNTRTGAGFEGAFGVYPFSPSGNVYVSDIDNGLFVFSFTPGNPTAVLITAFNAMYRDGAVVLEWEIGGADGLAGFNVYRSTEKDAGFVRVNNRLLDARGDYEFTDDGVLPGETYWYRLGAIDSDGEFFSPVRQVVIPDRSITMSLAQNYPNPFNPSTTISFDIPAASQVTLVVYDVTGKKIRTLLDTLHPAGPGSVVWNGADDAGQPVATGTYVYRLEAGGKVLMRRMLLVK